MDKKKEMTTPKKPAVEVDGDDKKKTMWENGYIRAFSHRHVVWVLGFVKGSPQANAFGLSMPNGPMIVVADYKGKVIHVK